jgi:hypothetical protein
MKKLFFLLTFALPAALSAGGPLITNAIVPQYIQGTTTSGNNNRVPFWFWAQISGLTPGATYKYYVTMDSLLASSTSNGAGNLIMINPYSGDFRRSINPSMSSYSGHDTLVADVTGSYFGWFGVEPTGNGRFTPGQVLYPKFMLNNGAGGTAVAMRVLVPFPVTVINFGTTSMSALQGSAIHDSLDAAPRNFIALYDNTAVIGRPVGIAIVEDDSLYLSSVTSYSNFYTNLVDSMPMHWGTIVPNDLPNGIRALQELEFINAVPIDTVIDADGIWCSGLNTVNMSNGSQPRNLNSTFVLTSSATIPDTTWTGFVTTFTATSNAVSPTYTWDFGDSNTGSGPVSTNTYANPGTYMVQVIVTTGGCTDTIWETVVVLLSTNVPQMQKLWFGVTPNPTNGELVLTTKDNNEKTITVTNMLGEMIFTSRTEGTTIRIDLTGTPAGIYFIEVKDEVTGKIGLKKIVLQ